VEPTPHPAPGVEDAQVLPVGLARPFEIPAEDPDVDVVELGKALPLVPERPLRPRRDGRRGERPLGNEIGMAGEEAGVVAHERRLRLAG
jgi:hypothetical protein